MKTKKNKKQQFANPLNDLKLHYMAGIITLNELVIKAFACGFDCGFKAHK